VTRFLLPAVCLAAALALSACTGDPAAPSLEPVEATPLDPTPAGADAGLLTVGAAGRLVAAATVRDVAALTVVGDSTPAVVSGSPGAGLVADTGFAALDGQLVVGRWAPRTGGYLLTVLDASGAIVAENPVAPWPAGAVSDVDSAVTPGGQLLLAVAREGGDPELLLVDPLTGTVAASTGLGPGAEVEGVAVSPDGRSVVVAVGSRDIGTGRAVSWLVPLTAGLEPRGGAVAVTPAEEWAEVEALAVDDAGTAWAVAATRDEATLVTAAPGAIGTTAVRPLADGATGLAVHDGVAWLVSSAAGAQLYRIDLRSGATATSEQLCDQVAGTSGGGPAVTGGRVYVSGSCADGARVWEFGLS
jgi:hypothetical protein